MIKLRYYLIITSLILLAISTSVLAYNPQIYDTTGSFTTNGYTITYNGQTYQDLDASSSVSAEYGNGFTYNNRYEVVENITLKKFPLNKYINGYIDIYYTLTPDTGNIQRTLSAESPILTNNNIIEGVSVTITRNQTPTSDQICLNIKFDNYYTTNANLGLPSIIHYYNEIASAYNTPVTFTFDVPQRAFNLNITDAPIINGELDVILQYLKNRPTIPYTLQTGAVLTTGDKQILNRNTNYRYVIFKKSDLVKYIYYYAFGPNQNYNIIYFKDLPDLSGSSNIDLTDYVSRGIKTTISGEQYKSIDFQYDEEYVLINFGGTRILNAYIGEGYQYQALIYYINSMLEMNEEQSSIAAEIESQYQDQKNQSDQILTGLNSVTMPSMAAADFDIMANTNAGEKVNFFGLISLITHNGLITTILLTIITAAIAGFILYGKRS